MDFKYLFNPSSVAVIGSTSAGKLAFILTHRLIEGGMKKIFNVNPKGRGVDNIPGFVSVGDIGEPVDMAVIASPAATVRNVLEDCGQAGVKAAVIISSGFSEMGNEQGEKDIMATAARYGIRFIGPNCAGLVNTHGNLLATLETTPPRGNIAIVSQSGAVGGALMAMAGEQELGISKFVSYGNGIDINVIDLLLSLKDDVETRVIALYIETVENGREFMRVLSEVSKVKPIVAIKSGRTSTGQRAALSHTGSMAGSDDVFDAALKQCGVIRVETLEDMFDTCKGFSLLPPVHGSRLLIVTNSGGPGVMTADRAEQMGLQVGEPGEQLKKALQEFLPAYAGIRNPIDLTVEGTGEEYRQAVTTALAEYDAAVAVYIGTPYLQSMPIAQGIVQAAKACAKPVCAVLQVGSDIAAGKSHLRENKIPEFVSGEHAARTLGLMAEYEAHKNDLVALEQPPDACLELGGNLPRLEPEAMSLLSKSGLPVPPNRFASTCTAAVQACRDLCYPAVMKVVSPDILHKSDVGGVVLNIADDTAAADAFDHLQKIARGKDFRGVIVYPMLKAGIEVILGLTHDPQFGPVVALGLGGIYTEVFRDVAFRVAPVNKKTALDMIHSLRSYPILKGTRGKETNNLEALANTIVKFSQLPFLYPEINEADLNPVIVYPQGVVVADVRILGKN